MFVLANKQSKAIIVKLKNFTTMATNNATTKVHVNFVSESEKYVGRTNISVDEKLKQLNEQGVEVDVQQFSMDNYALELSLREKSKDFRKYALIANGHLEIGEIGMLLFGAELEITRTLKKAGEKREVGDGTYERDTYTTRIDSVSLSEDAMLDELKASIRERKALAKVANANPFGF